MAILYHAIIATSWWKTYASHLLKLCLQASNNHKPDRRLSYVEGARDVAVLEAMLESGMKGGAVVPVKRF